MRYSLQYYLGGQVAGNLEVNGTVPLLNVTARLRPYGGPVILGSGGDLTPMALQSDDFSPFVIHSLDTTPLAISGGASRSL